MSDSLLDADSFLLSLIPISIRSVSLLLLISNITIPTVTGPANVPLPTSSIPAIYFFLSVIIVFSN